MSLHIDPLLIPWLPKLAPGVVGFAEVIDGIFVLQIIAAVEEGSGAVGNYLDSLPEHAIVSTVTSDRLAGMLERRGFVLEGFDWVRR